MPETRVPSPDYRDWCNSGWHVRWLGGRDALTDLALDWVHLDAAAKSPTQQFEWLRAAAAAFAHDQDFRLATVWRHDALVAAAPLVMWPRGACRQARLLGLSELHEPMDLFLADTAACEPLVALLIQEGMPLFLERLAADSPTFGALERICRGKASLAIRPQPDLSLHPARRLLARARTTYERRPPFGPAAGAPPGRALGEVVTRIVAPRPRELGELLDLALEIESKNWKSAAGTALVCDAARASFFRRYAAAASRAGTLRLCFLEIGGKPAAMQVAVQCCDGFWLLKIGYDQEFARCSPGLLLMRETVSATAAAGLATYEFLGTAEAWTDVWTRQVREHVSVRIYPWRPAGLAALAVDTTESLRSRWSHA